MVDNHELERRALELFRAGRFEEASRLQEEFLRQVMTSGRDLCTCPSGCKYHGRCVECVMIPRGHGDHLPYCFREMVNRKLAELAALTEHYLSERPPER